MVRESFEQRSPSPDKCSESPLIREKIGNIEMLIAVVACSSAVHDGVAIYSCEQH